MSTLNMGIFSELTNSKADIDLRNVDLSKTDILIEYQEPSAGNNYTWYRLYASGWCEQGGSITGWNGREYVGSINLPIAMVDVLYDVFIQPTSARGDATDWNFSNGATPKSTTRFSYSVYGIGAGDLATGMRWYVCGKANMAGHEILPTSAAAQASSIQAFEHRVIDFQKPTEENNYKWFRKYADGWVEQGGMLATNASTNTVQLPITMANTNYLIMLSVGNVNGTGSTGYERCHGWGQRTTTTFHVDSYATTNVTGFWEVKGLYA